MKTTVEIPVPDIGDFSDIEVIEVYVAPGDEVAAEDSLITLESDKATMDVPCPDAGSVVEVYLKPGDKVSQGTPILALLTIAEDHAVESANPDTPTTTVSANTAQASATTPDSNPGPDERTELVVIGAGPGGYTAAFRAADLGLSVTLVERYPDLGGVCLNVGCIPSKALLHAAKVIVDSQEMAAHGIQFSTPEIDLRKLHQWQQSVVKKLTEGLKGLAKQRQVKVVQGLAHFSSPHTLTVVNATGQHHSLGFEKAIIATGSSSIRIPGLPEDPRIFDSTGALALSSIPERLLVIGGGIIGLEMATVYHALGSVVTIVEMLDQIIPGADPDLVKPLARRLGKQVAAIRTKTRVDSVAAGASLRVQLSHNKGTEELEFDAILVSVGRRPNSRSLQLEQAGLTADEHGFIQVDSQQKTRVDHLFAIGDIVGQPMLAHKAVHEGKVAAEVAAGQKSGFDARVIPAVAYTDPEVAWAGLTELDAKAAGTDFEKGVFPWAASGRSLSLGRNEGMTKLLFDPQSKQLLGAGIVGPGAGDLIAEAALAIEMGADAEDIALTIHPHPTLSETIAMAAEAFSGSITDLYVPKK